MHPLSAIPSLSSLPSAPASLYLDFDGHTEARWGNFTNANARVFDLDGDESTFNDTELETMRAIWNYVAEDFAPFNINVTTVLPASFADRVATRVAIGGSQNDWYLPQNPGQPASGIALIGSFTDPSQPNTAYMFSSDYRSNTKGIADITSHEAGHGFNLVHESLWGPGDVKLQEYYRGTIDRAPIMGNPFSGTRAVWWYGTSANGPRIYQDDMSLIASSSNGFGYRPDDHGDSFASATPLTVNSSLLPIPTPMEDPQLSSNGIINSVSDLDYFSFETLAGDVKLQILVPQDYGNLDVRIELRDATGKVIAASAPQYDLGASISAHLADGTYYIVVASNGLYGDVGAYSIVASRPPMAPISGYSWTDEDYDGVFDTNELPNSGRTIYIDANQNGQRDAGEITTRTDASGHYAFPTATPGVQWISEERPSNVLYSYSAAGLYYSVGIDPNPTGGNYVNNVYATDIHGNQHCLSKTTLTEILTDIAYDPNNQVLYGASTRSLYRIDMNSGNISLVGQFAEQIGADIAFNPNSGKLYSYQGTKGLLEIDPVTLRVNTVNSTRFTTSSSGGLAYSQYEDRIYYQTTNGLWFYNASSLGTAPQMLGYSPAVGAISNLTNNGFDLIYGVAHDPVLDQPNLMTFAPGQGPRGLFPAGLPQIEFFGLEWAPIYTSLNTQAVHVLSFPLGPSRYTKLADFSRNINFGSVSYDHTSPAVVSITPTDKSTLQMGPTEILVNFSEPMDQSVGLTSNSLHLSGPGVGGAYVITAHWLDSDTAQFTLAGTWGNGQVDLQMNDSLPRDLSRNSLLPYRGGFTVGAPSFTIDDGGPGFTLSGVWTAATDGSPQQEHHWVSDRPSSTDKATWTFIGLPAGKYQVLAHWFEAPDRTTAAMYKIYPDASSGTPVYVNQRTAATGVDTLGMSWARLTTVSVSQGVLQVVLKDGLFGTISADAIRIEQLAPDAPAAPPTASFVGVPWDDHDIDQDGFVSGMDLLLLVSDLNTSGAHVVDGESAGYDINDDGFVSGMDLIQTVARLNSHDASVATPSQTLASPLSEAILNAPEPAGASLSADYTVAAPTPPPSAAVLGPVAVDAVLLAMDAENTPQQSSMVDGLTRDVIANREEAAFVPSSQRLLQGGVDRPDSVGYRSTRLHKIDRAALEFLLSQSAWWLEHAQ